MTTSVEDLLNIWKREGVISLLQADLPMPDKAALDTAMASLNPQQQRDMLAALSDMMADVASYRDNLMQTMAQLRQEVEIAEKLGNACISYVRQQHD